MRMRASSPIPLDYGRPTPRNRSLLRMWISHGLLMILILIGIGLLLQPQRSSSNGFSRTIPPECGQHLSQIGRELQRYAQSHQGHFPNTFDELLDNGASPSIFICPDSQDTPASGGFFRNAKHLGLGHCSYFYCGKGLSLPVQADTVLCYEAVADHWCAANVLLANGRVKWVTPPEWADLQTDLNAGQNPPRPGLVH